MPSAYPGGTMVAKVNGKASVETGLIQGISVVTGGHDHACAAMAVKAFEQGVMLDSMGTAESTMIAVKEPKLSHDSYMKALCMYPHCGQNKYRVMTSIQACGASIEWLLSRFGGDVRQRSVATNRNVYDMLMEDETQNSLPGASGLFFIPQIRGALGNPNARGAFIGIKDSHNMGDFVRAIMEGLSFELRSRVDDLQDIFGTTFTTIRSVGGITRSNLWMQVKADILGCAVEIPNEEEAASFGAALLAAMGAGIFKDEVEAANHLYRHKSTYYPSGERLNLNKRYELYKQAVLALMNIYNAY
jgi:xylulokinase